VFEAPFQLLVPVVALVAYALVMMLWVFRSKSADSKSGL
jgi:hypothetical protein